MALMIPPPLRAPSSFSSIVALLLAVCSPIVTGIWVASDVRVEYEHRFTGLESGFAALEYRVAAASELLNQKLDSQHQEAQTANADTQKKFDDLQGQIRQVWADVSRVKGAVLQ